MIIIYFSFRIPKNPNVRHAWIAFCKLDESIDDISKVLICSKHFLSTDYIEPRARELGNNLILKPGSVPSIFKPQMKFHLTSSKQDVDMKGKNLIFTSNILLITFIANLNIFHKFKIFHLIKSLICFSTTYLGIRCWI